ncbi:MAG: hypothetical protein GX493_11725 [Firmicutes bacterium]|nr:hypothetical protein [Bacillota bacterium]
MKILPAVALALMMVLALAGRAMAMPHTGNWPGDFLAVDEESRGLNWPLEPTHEKIFGVEDEERGFLFGAIMEEDGMTIGGEFYLGDRAFLGGGYSFNSWESFGFLLGSHLFDFGLVVGGTAYSDDDGDHFVILSPGYRISPGADGYIVVGVDYGVGGDHRGPIGYEINVKYRTDESKITGQLWLPAEGDDYWGYAKANMAMDEELVWGGGIWFAKGEEEFFIGATWKPKGLLLDGLVYFYNEGASFVFSGLYFLTDDLAVGLAYEGDIGWGHLKAKAKYATDEGELGFVYIVDTDGAWKTALSYMMKL